MNTYELSASGRSILCLVCLRPSFNSGDVRHLYCGWCRRYHADLGAELEQLRQKEEFCYLGLRLCWGAQVLVTEPGGGLRVLGGRLDLRNHSPTGFDWGYSGSGPAQLALAILADYLKIGRGSAAGESAALFLVYQDFKREIIAGLPQAGWRLARREVEKWLYENQGNQSNSAGDSGQRQGVGPDLVA